MRATSTERFLGPVWLPTFVIGQIVTFGLLLALDPAGFDVCEGVPSPTARAGQVAVIALAVLISAAIALWRLRGSSLVAALLVTSFTGVVWGWLLFGGGTPSC